jgi:hypothetical protein
LFHPLLLAGALGNNRPMNIAAALLIACSGFLLAVLWMDLMFDAQARTAGRSGADLPESALASIAGYYRRAVTESRPMSRLIAGVMLLLLAALGVRVAGRHDPAWLLALSALLAGAPILLALTRTVPNAARLGSRSGSPADQTALARAIWRDHLVCAAGMLAFLALWVARSAGI